MQTVAANAKADEEQLAVEMALTNLWLVPAAINEKLANAVQAVVAIGETVVLLHLPLPLAGVSIGMQEGRQQNDSLTDG